MVAPIFESNPDLLQKLDPLTGHRAIFSFFKHRVCFGLIFQPANEYEAFRTCWEATVNADKVGEFVEPLRPLVLVSVPYKSQSVQLVNLLLRQRRPPFPVHGALNLDPTGQGSIAIAGAYRHQTIVVRRFVLLESSIVFVPALIVQTPRKAQGIECLYPFVRKSIVVVGSSLAVAPCNKLLVYPFHSICWPYIWVLFSEFCQLLEARVPLWTLTFEQGRFETDNLAQTLVAERRFVAIDPLLQLELLTFHPAMKESVINFIVIMGRQFLFQEFKVSIPSSVVAVQSTQ